MDGSYVGHWDSAFGVCTLWAYGLGVEDLLRWTEFGGGNLHCRAIQTEIFVRVYLRYILRVCLCVCLCVCALMAMAS